MSDSKSAVLPIVISGIGCLILGIGVGAVGAGVFVAAPEPVADEGPRPLSEAEKEAIWGPKVAEATADVEAAHDKISSLEAVVAQREAKVTELEAEMTRRRAAGVAMKKDFEAQLEAAHAELAEAKSQLQTALAEKEQLTQELQQTHVALAEQKVATSDALAKDREQQWTSFVAQTKLDVCGKGSRNKLTECRELVTASLGAPVHDQFVHCLKAGQESPTIRSADHEHDALPQFASWLGPDEKSTRDWFVQLCDPTLPEVDGVTASSEPAPVPAAGT